MPIDFPTSPTTGQVYTYQGKSWVYNGTGWDSPRALSEIGAVQTFANAAARTAAIPTPTEGIVSYLNDVDLLSIYDGTGWGNSLSPKGGILQVVQAVKTDTFTTSSTSFVDVTGLTVTITPKSNLSKILVIGDFYFGTSSGGFAAHAQLVRGSTAIYVGSTSSPAVNATSSVRPFTGAPFQRATPHFLDAPNTTSATTYKVQTRIGTSGANANWGGDASTGDANLSRVAQSITLMEVSA
jgi:hypothetical protein